MVKIIENLDGIELNDDFHDKYYISVIMRSGMYEKCLLSYLASEGHAVSFFHPMYDVLKCIGHGHGHGHPDGQWS